ncbi:MAG: group II intron maturase-specific domain-containing protein [Burkholderiales bacterium]
MSVNYYRHVVARSTFEMVDKELFKIIWKWVKRRHPNKSAKWIRNKYFCKIDNDNWEFNAGYKPQNGRFK